MSVTNVTVLSLEEVKGILEKNAPKKTARKKKVAKKK
jgi:hypothetical protein